MPHVEDAFTLWSRFAAEHAGEIPQRLTCAQYLALAPTFVAWVRDQRPMGTAMTHWILASVWTFLTQAPAYRDAIVLALLTSDVPHDGLPFTTTVGHDGILFQYPDVLTALGLEQDRADVEPHLHLLPRVNAAGMLVTCVTATDVLDECALLSMQPACQAYRKWMCRSFAPALARHGWYNPATGHTAPPGQELEALEMREGCRDLLNALVPGMGDVEAGQRPTSPEGRRLLWHRLVDEDGHVVLVNDADLPDEGEEAAGA
jgi:hypothetical protein